MFMVNCYSVELTYSTHLELSDDELMDKCTFEYGVEVTPEIYLSIQPRNVRVLPLGFKDGIERVKVFYLNKEYIADRKEVTHEEST